jgi:hypothetical protein
MLVAKIKEETAMWCLVAANALSNIMQLGRKARLAARLPAYGEQANTKNR